MLSTCHGRKQCIFARKHPGKSNEASLLSIVSGTDKLNLPYILRRQAMRTLPPPWILWCFEDRELIDKDLIMRVGYQDFEGTLHLPVTIQKYFRRTTVVI